MSKPLITLPFVLALAACVESGPPSAPPAPVDPPEVAQSGFLTAYTEAVVPLGLSDLRAFMEDQPLITFLRPVGSISNPVETRVLEGTWPTPGAVRWVKLADGHYVIERVTRNDPDAFDYQIFIFTNSVGRGVEQIVGQQRFVPAEGGTAFQWSYNVLPRNLITRQVVRRNMDTIETYISDGLARFAAAATAHATGG